VIRWFARWPAQTVLTLALALLALLTGAAALWAHRESARRDAVDDTRTLLAELAQMQAARLSALAGLDEGVGLQRLITTLALHPAVEEAWWVDAEGRVRGSLWRQDLGQPLAAALARAGLDPAVLERPPEALPPRQLAPLPASRPLDLRPELGGRGQLLILGTARGAFTERLHDAYQNFGLELVRIGLIAAGLWWLLGELWVRRGQALRDYARQLRLRELPPPAELAGGDELAAVAQVLGEVGHAWHRDARLLRALGECSRLALHHPEADALLPAVCAVLVEEGGFAAAAAWRLEAGGRRLQRLCLKGEAARLPGPEALDLDTPADATHPLALALRERRAVAATLEGQDLALLPIVGPEQGFGLLALAPPVGRPLPPATLDALGTVAADLSLSLGHQESLRRAHEADRRLAAALTAAHLAAWEQDLAEGRLQASERWFAMLGRPPQPAVARTEWQSWVHHEDLARLHEAEACIVRGERTHCEVDLRLRHAEGHWVWVHLLGNVLARDTAGRALRMGGVAMDISARREAEAAQRLAKAIVDNTREGILVCDADGRILSVNPAFERLTGYAAGEVLGRKPSVLSSGLHDEAFYAAMWDALLRHGRWEGEIWNRRRNGELYPEHLSIIRVPEGEPSGACYVGQFTDMSERQAILKRLDLLSRTDPLTGLPNRRSFLGEVEAALARDPVLALLCLNLDGFRQVNQSLGMQAGDEVLRTVAGRLREVLGEAALLARLEGDLFAAALPGLDAGEAQARAAAIHAAFRHPLTVHDTPVAIGLSIGLALAPQHGSDPEMLLVAATSAIQIAREGGRNSLGVYTPGRGRASRERLTLESELRLALENGELFLRFQPQVSLEDGHLVGIEALVRWQHPLRGELSPGLFIGLAEDTGLIVPLGDFVLREACAANMRLQAAGLPPVPVSVNVSALQFRRDRFLSDVMAALRESGLPASLLELELTESLLMRDTEDALARLRLVRERGIRLAIDDFGTGFSSLSYLSRMAIDRLKIDQAFVRDMRRSAGAEGIVKTIIALAHHLGLTVVAEGVEHPEDARHLRALGCDDAQGYLYGQPMDEAALLAFVRHLPAMPRALQPS